MALTSKITPYDDRWPSLFDAEKARVQRVFAPHVVEIEHVGSTAVPGLTAEPEIDLMVVSDHQDQDQVDRGDDFPRVRERKEPLGRAHILPTRCRWRSDP
ncbi:GrpB family protein [uncultured Agrobacterium sp.]|uniref:GrpB family protein n=1 Tax=Agrobacterium cavarae TaxID=2528239 RepID=UPI0025EADEDC|nr:GrpB family protein [uncultured Agrobacterium sp.]